MEFVGQSVKKEFQGLGILIGVVNSFDPSSGFLEIVYEDGDSEEIDVAEVISLLKGEVEPGTSELIETAEGGGRRPKKRRRREAKWEIPFGSGMSSDSLVRNCCSKEGFEETQLKGGVIRREFVGALERECGFGENLKETGCVSGIDEWNTNVKLEENLKKNVDYDGNVCAYSGLGGALKEGESFGSAERTRETECYFDGNLKGNGALEGILRAGESAGSTEETQKEVRCFDGNSPMNGNIGGTLEDGEPVDSAEETCKEECRSDVHSSHQDKMEMAITSCGGNLIESTSLSQVNESVVDGNCEEFASVGAAETTPIKGGISNGSLQEDTYFGTHLEIRANNGGSSWKQITDETSSGIVEGICKEVGEENSRKKRRRISRNLRSKADTVLRRSTRRLTSNISCQNLDSSVERSQEANDVTFNPEVNSVSDRKLDGSAGEGYQGQTNVLQNLELFPSSKNLNLDGIHVLDIFSIYACLRSFSTSLFLSPFSLEAFVEALGCDFSNSLIDFIHCSILQTLKKHLEFLSSEGSESAIVCLRSLNWGVLDLVTWPVFMVEYLIICGPELKPGFDLSHLKILNSDYYKQPVAVKVELLRCLCDHVIEVDAIRLELNRRSLRSEIDVDIDRAVNIEKRRKDPVDDLGGSCLTEDINNKTADWNSDECCLCRMDGSLICCDGCPAAYHLRCVGVTSELLPEGEWYCPECVIDKREPWMKSSKSLRGAELLGVDPLGRLYFSCCGYLLVSNSHDQESSYSYYHRNDLNAVIDAMKSLDSLYGGLINAISMHWEIPVDPIGVKDQLGSQNHIGCKDLDLQVSDIHMCSISVTPSATNEVSNVLIDGRKSTDDSVTAEDCGHQSFKVSQSVNKLDSISTSQFSEIASSFVNSEGSPETSRPPKTVQTSEKTGEDCLNKYCRISNKAGFLDKPGHSPFVTNPRNGETSQLPVETGYINHYSFARTAASVADELTHKLSGGINEDSKVFSGEIISAQLKVIAKRSCFFWPDIQKLSSDVQKENCGWCFSCKNSTDNGDCLFNANGDKHENIKSAVLGVNSKRPIKSHLVAVVCHILSIEDRLCGLLMGPWQNPNYAKLWHRSVLKLYDISSVKHLILTLEANLSRIALLPEWLKQVDSVDTVGSASHVLTSSSNVSSKHGMGRKRARFSDSDSCSSLNSPSQPAIFWWRGGRISRQLFHWKVLPRSLAYKGGRQAGSKKIPGIFYPDGSEFAKRSKYVAWQAAVETSSSTAQLALLVRELDANIRWDDLEKTQYFSQLAKESRNIMRPFKKVIIRRKCIEGACVKYLLDFGKRKNIPDTVVRHGTMFEASSSERKKYWVDESHVPLYLLKSFEAKKLARKVNKVKPEKLPLELGMVVKKPSRKRGLSYLLSKGEKSENCLCGHCKKDVLVREAVNCQYCQGFFHVRHVRKFKASVTAESTYTCHKCHNEKLAKMKPEKGKVRSQKHKKASSDSRPVRARNCKKASTVQSQGGKNTSISGRVTRSQNKQKLCTDVRPQRSAKKVKYISVQRKKLRRRKKGKQVQTKRVMPTKSKKNICWYKRKRTQVYHTYWLNGILTSRKPNDERSVHFRERRVLLVNHSNAAHKDPKCCLCLECGYASTSFYVGCENCEDWFHGDALGLNMENVNNILGFRCHKCLKRNPPVCPYLQVVQSDEVQLPEANNCSWSESAGDVCKTNELPSGDPALFNMHDSIHQKQNPGKMEYKMESEEEKNVILHYIDEEQKPDALRSSNLTTMLEESNGESDKINAIAVESLSNSRYSPSKYDENATATGVASPDNHKVEDGLVEMTAIPEFVQNERVHLPTTVSSIELLDTGL